MSEVTTFEDSLENLFDIENGSTESIIQPIANVVETNNSVAVVDTNTRGNNRI